MKLLTLYHEVQKHVFCPDGITSAWVASKRYPNSDFTGYQPLRADATFENFLESYPQTLSYSHLLFVDCSINPNIVSALQDQGIAVKIIDHHKSALEAFSGSDLLSRLTYDLGECGATLCWKELMGSNPMPAFLSYVRDRDLYTQALEHTEAVHSGVQSAIRRLGQDLDRQFSLLDDLSRLDLEKFLEIARFDLKGQELSDKRKAKVLALYNRRPKSTIELAGVEIPSIALKISDEAYHSDIGALYMKDCDLPAVALIRPTKISLRSDGSLDCSEIAASFGGGGHLKAASFERFGKNLPPHPSLAEALSPLDCEKLLEIARSDLKAQNL
jgi:oligoribonuclease NrnB/cAMP/cGMP phosphodiesterase (DHH superfamily)